MIGLVVGGLASGVGKTTLTLGLIGALRRRGLSVQPFKVGPDYIDPSQHAQVAGRPSRNLDSWLVPEAALRELFGRAAASADVALVEGVMGLFDGRTGAGEIGSTAHVAKLLDLPVLLVVDAAKAGRSVAAAVAGSRALDPDLRIVGVVLNNVAGERHAEIGREAVESLAGLPVLGWLPRNSDLHQEERYLGLVPAAERRLANALVERATEQVERYLDLDRLLRLTTATHPPVPTSGLFPAEPVPRRARIAVAQDEAFSFYYQDSLDLLTAWGAELVRFSPLRDQRLPVAIGGVYLGGGFPGFFAGEFSSNESMLTSIRMAASEGLPIYGECGGLMYLQEALIDADGLRHPMTSLVPGVSTLVGKRLTLGYREVSARRETPLLTSGQRVRGHEFHWSVCDAPASESAAYDLLDISGRVEGYALDNVLASYVHLHFASHPDLAPRFVEACASVQAGGPRRHATVDVQPALRRERADQRAATLPGSMLSDGSNGSALPDSVQPAQDAVNSAASANHGLVVRPGPGPLVRRHGLPPAEIEALSGRRIEARVGALLPILEPARGMVARLVYASGDPELAERVVLAGDPIEAASAAFARSTNLVVDVRMVAAGISRSGLARLGVEMQIAIQASVTEALARQLGVTRSAAGIRALADRLDGAVVAIGNAPTALLALLDLVAGEGIRPAAVIGMPVGFVAAEESKELLLQAGLPCIVVRGTRGGSGLAAAAVNYLLRLAGESLDRSSSESSPAAVRPPLDPRS